MAPQPLHRPSGGGDGRVLWSNEDNLLKVEQDVEEEAWQVE